VIINAPASMDMLHQVRKALGDISVAQQQEDVMKVYYLAWALRDMVSRGNRSWSTYRFMVNEEFD
jgi:hypothetical protein